MKKTIFFLLFFSILSLSNGLSSSTTFASSSYVLPYPSTMPGGVSYKVHLVWEAISKYWYFGDFGQFEYNLKESDKYLVESKTLFEYQQYLLGFNALQKSNEYFAQTLPDLEKAKKNGKDISNKREQLREAAAKHEEVLQKMKIETPITFTWNPEKASQSELPLHQRIDTLIQTAKQYE
jgi:CRISPR/Cas system-associated protein Cas5 (RAMP superfamily)